MTKSIRPFIAHTAKPSKEVNPWIALSLAKTEGDASLHDARFGAIRSNQS
jgi:hypothetical protein